MCFVNVDIISVNQVQYVGLLQPLNNLEMLVTFSLALNFGLDRQ